MKAKEFLQGKTLTAVEIVDTLVINIVIEEAIYGLNVDTSGIGEGFQLTRTSGFTLDGDTLTVGGLTLGLSTSDTLEGSKISLDLSTTDLLGTIESTPSGGTED